MFRYIAVIIKAVALEKTASPVGLVLLPKIPSLDRQRVSNFIAPEHDAVGGVLVVFLLAPMQREVLPVNLDVRVACRVLGSVAVHGAVKNCCG